MEFFKFFLFGITGASVIFWVCVIALWHTYMFPRLFAEDNLSLNNNNDYLQPNNSTIKDSPFIQEGDIWPLIKGVSLQNRFKYYRKSFVIADFSPLEDGYSTNRLYTAVLLSLGVASFLMVSYGLHSALL